MKIALAQINPVVGDLQGNSSKIISFAHQARARGADLAVFPELGVIGYPPQDLLENATFLREARDARARVAAQAPQDMGIILGGVAPNTTGSGKRLFNAAFVYDGGRLVATAHKTLLPTYDVFDERRHFEPATRQHVVVWRGRKLGLHICEDLWAEPFTGESLYHANPIRALAEQGADCLINVCASPFAVGKRAAREALIRSCCRRHGLPYLFVNQVGANTQLIFDGSSGVYAPGGDALLRAPQFEEALLVLDTETEYEVRAEDEVEEGQGDVRSLHGALVLGIRDYFHKTGAFTKALVGLSGGIDSAVTCALAVEALGPERVVGVTMPSIYSSAGSVSDSATLADNLGVTFRTIPIKEPVTAFERALADPFEGTESGVAEENIQARTRGVLLMALSNKFQYLLLSTGNKSELAVGYATLYGDMNGGLAVLGDVLKTEVYRLAECINLRAGRDLIPRETITKPPSAELRPNQKDQDSLPPYSVLDDILRGYIERREDLDDIVQSTGLARSLVMDILQRVDRNEYKRRQAPPCLRVTGKAFGPGRSLPIVMRWNR